MKSIIPVKEHEIIGLARERLIETLRRVGGCDLGDHEWVGRETGFPSEPGYDLSLLVTEKGGQVWQLRAAIKAVGYPKQVREAAWRLKRNPQRGTLERPVYPLFIAPYLSAESTRICEEEEIGYLDLSGNCHLEFGGVCIHVEGKPNRYPDVRELKNLYSTKSSRILRVLLEGPLRPHLVQELAHKAGVSLGLVSKVRKHLLEQELAEAPPEGLVVTRPSEILRDWTFADDLAERSEVREYSLLEADHEQVARNIDRLLGERGHAFTQWTAAHLRQPHVPPQVTSLYVESFPEDTLLKEALKARRVDRGGRLRLYRPLDEGVFIGRQVVDGLPLVSDLQIYLDLLDADAELRAGEAARELRELPDFSGGW